MQNTIAHLPMHLAATPFQAVGLKTLRDLVVARVFVRARACNDDVNVVVFATDIDVLAAQGGDDDALAQLGDVIENHLCVGGLVRVLVERVHGVQAALGSVSCRRVVEL